MGEEKDEEGNVTASRVEFAADTSTAKVWMPAATFASFRDAIRGKGPAQKAHHNKLFCIWITFRYLFSKLVYAGGDFCLGN